MANRIPKPIGLSKTDPLRPQVDKTAVAAQTVEDETSCVVCTVSPVTDNCYVHPCGHRLGCWSCVRRGFSTLGRCWLCRDLVACIMREATGEMFVLALHFDKNYMASRHPIPITPLERQVARRMYIYRHCLFSRHIGSNAASGYREVTPQRFTHDLALQSRARAFLRRELRVFVLVLRGLRFSFYCPGILQQVENMAQCFVLMLKKWDLKDCSGAAEEVVRARLHLALPKMRDGPTVVKLFVHELRAYLMSPYTRLLDWDASVQYNEPQGILAPVPPLVVDDPHVGMVFEETPVLCSPLCQDPVIQAHESMNAVVPSGSVESRNGPDAHASRMTEENQETPSIPTTFAYTSTSHSLQDRAAESNHNPNQANQGLGHQETARRRSLLEALLAHRASARGRAQIGQMFAHYIPDEPEQRPASVQDARALPRRTTTVGAVDERQSRITSEPRARQIENSLAATGSHNPDAVVAGTSEEASSPSQRTVGALPGTVDDLRATMRRRRRRRRRESSQLLIANDGPARESQDSWAAPRPAQEPAQRQYVTRSAARRLAKQGADGLQAESDAGSRNSSQHGSGNLGRARGQRGSMTQGQSTAINSRREATQDHIDQRNGTAAS